MPADGRSADLAARTVGFASAGIGNMGWPMAANLVRADQVAGADAASGRAARFASRSAAGARDGAGSVVVGADVLVTSLP